MARKNKKNDEKPNGVAPAVNEAPKKGNGENARKAKTVQPPAKKNSKAVVKKTKSGEPKVSFVQKSKVFLREVRVELKKVTWPSRKETVASTAIVVILVVIISAFMGVVDFGLTSFIRLLIG